MRATVPYGVARVVVVKEVVVLESKEKERKSNNNIIMEASFIEFWGKWGCIRLVSKNQPFMSLWLMNAASRGLLARGALPDHGSHDTFRWFPQCGDIFLLSRDQVVNLLLTDPSALWMRPSRPSGSAVMVRLHENSCAEFAAKPSWTTRQQQNHADSFLKQCIRRWACPFLKTSRSSRQPPALSITVPSSGSQGASTGGLTPCWRTRLSRTTASRSR